MTMNRIERAQTIAANVGDFLDALQKLEQATPVENELAETVIKMGGLITVLADTTVGLLLETTT